MDSSNPDPLFRCKSMIAAKRWVQQNWELASTEQRFMIMKAFFQWPSDLIRKRASSKKSHKGGARSRGDIRILRLLAAVDTFHDFSEYGITEMSGFEKPSEISQEILFDEQQFTEKIGSLKYLTFSSSSQPVRNPLYGAKWKELPFDIEAHGSVEMTIDNMFIKQKMRVQQMVGMRRNIIPVDIWRIQGIQSRTNDAVIRLHQVAQTIGVLRRLYGNRIETIVDTSDQVANLVVSLKHVRYSLYLRICEEIEDPMTRDAYPKKIRELLRKEGMEEGDWSIVENDATLFDANTNKIPNVIIDPVPTGDIYLHEMGGYQVSLQGVHDVNGRREIKIKVEDIDQTNHIFSFSSNITSKHLSIAGIVKCMTKANCTNNSITKEQQSLMKLSTELLLAMKRAGDWGQVESCIRGNRVFFTRDRLAALYAYYRGVRFVFVRVKEYEDDEWIQKYPFLQQYTFCMAWPSRLHMV